MKKILGALLAVAAFGIPSPASAAPTELCKSVTVGNDVCATGSFTISGGNVLTVRLYNSSDHYSILSKFGIGGDIGDNDHNSTGTWSLGSATFHNWNGSSVTNTALAWWTFDSSNPELGISITAGADTGPGNDGLLPCDGTGTGPAPDATHIQTCEGGNGLTGNADWVEFVFNYSGTLLDNGAVSPLLWAYKMQSVDAFSGNSIECNTDVNSDKLCTSRNDFPNPPSEITPEPGTMTLLALGLVGMAAARRRKNKKS